MGYVVSKWQKQCSGVLYYLVSAVLLISFSDNRALFTVLITVSIGSAVVLIDYITSSDLLFKFWVSLSISIDSTLMVTQGRTFNRFLMSSLAVLILSLH